jgi:hypothetical protein
MLNEFLNKEKMKKPIVEEDYLSAPGLDILTYTILTYEKDDAAELMLNIMNWRIRLQQWPEAWKEEKVVILPKPCNQEKKNRPENRRPITLTDIFYRNIFWKNS